MNFFLFRIFGVNNFLLKDVHYLVNLTGSHYRLSQSGVFECLQSRYSFSSPFYYFGETFFVLFIHNSFPCLIFVA